MNRASLASAALVAAAAASCYADISYRADFQAEAGPEWSNRLVETTPLGGQRILGQFSNETIILTLASVRAGEMVNLSFDFLAIRTWDGNEGGGGPGPDTFSVAVHKGPDLVDATFAVGDPASAHRMTYSDKPGGGDVLSRAGAAANDSLGYLWRGAVLDATWHMHFAFVAPEDGLVIKFAASGLQPIDDESWALDNVELTSTTVPAPGPVVLVGAGLGLLAQRRRS
ncbi:MAG: hypothetical protein NTV94_06675 [Planctomycetota bacterium]|nr:hypothetical protein [Planctomycetota bacterium]